MSTHNGPFPQADGPFNSYVNVVVPYLGTAQERLGIDPARVAGATAKLATWNAAFAAIANPATRTQIAFDNKKAAKEDLTAHLRLIYGDLPQSKLTTTDRETLNMPERKAPSPAPIPTSVPIAEVDTSRSLQHTISFRNDDGKRAKPEGVRTAQIWVSVQEGLTPPVDMSAYEFVAADSKSPYVKTYTGALAGKNAFYRLRWENTRGEVGPWSEVVMATITA